MDRMITKLSGLRRPRLLIQAARIGASDYRRNTHLRRYFGPCHPPVPSDILSELLTQEDEINTLRENADARYRAGDHVDILIALMGEARLLRAAHQDSP